MSWLNGTVLPPLVLAALLGVPGFAAAGAQDSDPHALHQAAESGVHLSRAEYVTPALWLVRADGQKVWLPKELDDGRPVVLNFIYTTCPGICPVMSEVFAQFQKHLGSDRGQVHMVSISIDPEQDTPARLRAYARKFEAESQWQHYTGTVEASVKVQEAFGAYQGDKMSHNPLTLMRAAPGKPWLRMDGFVSATQLMEQYTVLLRQGNAQLAAD